MLGDLNGLRKTAQEAGITLCSQYNAYLYDNAGGGLKRGPLAQGQLFSWIDIDLGKFTHLDLLSDTSLHAAMYALQGRPITAREVGAFSSASFFEATATNRIGTVWLERRFLDGKLSVRVGQLDLRLSELDGYGSAGRRHHISASRTGRADEMEPDRRRDLDGRRLYG
jgi:porin